MKKLLLTLLTFQILVLSLLLTVLDANAGPKGFCMRSAKYAQEIIDSGMIQDQYLTALKILNVVPDEQLRIGHELIKPWDKRIWDRIRVTGDPASTGAVLAQWAKFKGQLNWKARQQAMFTCYRVLTKGK